MIPAGESGIVVAMAITYPEVVMSEKSTGDPDRAVSGGVVLRPELFERLNRAGRVTEVSGPAGSGKSVLLRSWIEEADLAEHAAQVSVQDADRDPRRFWTVVADALRCTAAGSVLVRPVTAPDLDGWSIVERLLADLGSLRDRIWLVIDDVHALGSAEALGQLELLLTRAPAGLRFVLASRQNLRLGLHRLRLEGELTEIRAASLRFSRDEARALLEAAGARLSESALAQLHQRTEGWAAGLRLAALSLTDHPDPERFAAEFCGGERTVAEYLLAEVLDRQSEDVRRLLSRTSVLERVSGPLADRLTGGSGGERTLQKLEQAGAFVVALDARRSWFRYHPLFADLLALELRHTEPAELATLHGTAADWFAEHGFPVEAVRHAQAVQDWNRAGRLLADHGLDIAFNGQAATVHQLVTAFPADAVTANAELTAVAAAAELMRGSLEEGARYLALAAAGAASVPAERCDQFRVTMSILRLYLARQRGDFLADTEEVEQLRSAAVEVPQPRLGADLRALALISLGIAELWSLRVDEAEAHLERGVALAHRIGRPFLEISGRVHWAVAASFRSSALAAERSAQAIELARRHGWSKEPLVAIAYPVLAGSLSWQGKLEEAERWLMEGELALQSEVEPATEMLFQLVRGSLEIAGGHPVPELLDRHARQRTADPALIREIISLLGGRTPPVPPVPAVLAVPAPRPSEQLAEPLSQAEARVLRFLQTSLSAPEIARELYVSVNTVRTHMRHLYDKLGAHRRLEALDRARSLGLLAPVPQRAA
jgi:LuxR family maltose regulon positive regulatory protein